MQSAAAVEIFFYIFFPLFIWFFFNIFIFLYSFFFYIYFNFFFIDATLASLRRHFSVIVAPFPFLSDNYRLSVHYWTFHISMSISGFSFRNRHFAPFRVTWRHFDPLPVSYGTWHSSVFYLTCVRVLGVPLVYTPMSLFQVFPSKTAISRHFAQLCDILSHFRFHVALGAHQYSI